MKRNKPKSKQLDWTRVALSDVSEMEYPIKCIKCSYILTGLGNVGCCPECNTKFNRRHRLWVQYGSEKNRKLYISQWVSSLSSFLISHSLIILAAIIGSLLYLLYCYIGSRF